MEQRHLEKAGTAVSRVMLGCGNFGGIGSSPEFFGQGTRRTRHSGSWTPRGSSDHDVRHGRRVRRRPERDIHRRVARDQGRRRPGRIVIATKTFNPMAEGDDTASPARASTASSRQAWAGSASSGSPVPRARFRPGIPQEETLRRVRRARARRQDRRRRGVELHRRATRAKPSRSPSSKPSPATSGRRTRFSLLDAGRLGDRLPRVPRAPPRLHAVQPARRRLAHRQVPPRRASAGGLADDAPTGAPTRLRPDRVFDALETLERRSAQARSVDGRPGTRLAARAARDHRGRRRAEPAEHLAPAREALEHRLFPPTATA